MTGDLFLYGRLYKPLEGEALLEREVSLEEIT